MSVLSVLTIALIGWLIYRVIQRDNLEVSPASLPLMWILGTGGIYLIYYLFIGILHQNPPPLLILGLGGLGAIEGYRLRHQVKTDGWNEFKQEKGASMILFLIVLVMTVNIFMSGFHADTTRMWMAKGDMLNQLPDYAHLMESLPERLHPDYPMVISHQYQWQLVWSDELVSLKLSTFVWYIMLLLISLSLLTRWTKHPIRWLILLAGFPGYWFVVPIATLAIPLSVMWGVIMFGIIRYLDNEPTSLLSITLVCGVMTLTKNEGAIAIACIIIGLFVTALQDKTKRRQIARLIVVVVVICLISLFSWYGLIVGQTNAVVGSDFGLSGFQFSRIVEVAQIILPILLNPLSTAWLWVIFCRFYCAWLSANTHHMVACFTVFTDYFGVISI